MEKAIRVLDDAAKSLKSEIRIWDKQGDMDIVEKCKDELKQCEDAITKLSDGSKIAGTASKLNIACVMPMLRQIAEYLDCGIELANETKEWDEIHEIVEFIHGIAEDNHMFIRN